MKKDMWIGSMLASAILLGVTLGWWAHQPDKEVELVPDTPMEHCVEVERHYTVGGATSRTHRPYPAFPALTETTPTTYTDVREEVTLQCSFYKLRAKVPQ